MNKREETLIEALQKNEEEAQRWQTYLKENETAIDNMTMFNKHLSVEVMVPIGKKALMPGQLIHTNEVLVGHYQGYFSKCTTFKAKEICELRIKMAKDHLNKLETEAELWQNKLEKPYAEGVMPTGEEREIIEEYDEESEKQWKEKHRLRVKEAKQKEREDREKELIQKDKIISQRTKEEQDFEVFKMLEEAELMEELEEELNKLEFDEVNDETIRKLMSGEVKLPPEKKRIAHGNNLSNVNNCNDSLSLNIVKKNQIKDSIQSATNNNIQQNPELTNLIHSEEANEPEDEPIPEEVSLIKEQAKFLTPEDQIGFYEYQIQIIRQKLQVLPLRSEEQLNEKIRLHSVLEHLEELLEIAEETVGEAELADKDLEIDNNMEEELERSSEREKESKPCTENKNKYKQRISFALEDQTLEFRKEETVNQMLPPKLEKPTRDIVKLNDEDEVLQNRNITEACSTPSKKLEIIQAKVKENLQYVSENQSKQDFDLVQQILQNSMGEISTLKINFQHSEQEGYKKDNKENDGIPHSPADVYDLYVKSQKASTVSENSLLFVNSYEGEDKVKAPLLKETDRKEAFVDPKAKFSNPTVPTKSILKNKSAINKEIHCTEPKQNNNRNKKTKKNKAKEEDECLSAYYKVMNDVVEKPLTEPEPLPDVKFIDAHAPKKRVSRFKQMRQGTDKI